MAHDESAVRSSQAAAAPLNREIALRRQRRSWRVSRFQAVTSLLMALLMMIATFVSILVLVWWLDADPGNQTPNPIPVQTVSGRGAVEFDRDFSEPGHEEIQQLGDPTIDDLIQEIREIASRIAAPGSQNSLSAASEPGGDGRQIGPGTSNAIPPYERWELRFSASDRQAYARQLDHYEIELGAIGGGIRGVDYVSNLSSQPKVRRAESENEQRLYFLWNRLGPLQTYDRQLLFAAGVQLRDRVMLKFIPSGLEKRLVARELEYARSQGRHSADEIAKTVFQSQPVTGGYEFQVISQRYRKSGI